MLITDANDVVWDLEPLVGGKREAGVDALFDEADARAERLATRRGTLAGIDGPGLVGLMSEVADIREVVGRAWSYASLRFAADTLDPANGALLQKAQERSTAVTTKLLFIELEWVALPDDRATELLQTPGLDFCRHHLEAARRYRDHVLTEPEERAISELSVTGAKAWGRLFSELTSALQVDLEQETVPFEEALSRLSSPDRDVRRAAAGAITTGLAPGLRTRAFVFNTLLHNKAIEDRLRGYRHWLASRNLANQASDDSVAALVDAVRKRYDIPHRWFALKARIMGLDRLADFDRSAAVGDSDDQVSWGEARDTVLEAYNSFSSDLANLARQFFDEHWIDAGVRPGKRPGAFCAYTVPSHHPYVFVNYTGNRRDVLTLAHELGHGVHSALARGQGVFHQNTPLTLSETASVFGETVVFGRLLGTTTDPAGRLALLAASVDDAMGTIYRQVAMNQFEDRVHTARRTEGELSTDRFGELWADTQAEMLGDAVEVTDGYRSWWSYIPHFIATPGYVYAYAYGQLLALSVYRRYEEQGPDFVDRYLELLATGGSDWPENLARIVDCDLADPGFWDGGLAIVEDQVDKAEAAARDAGRI